MKRQKNRREIIQTIAKIFLLMVTFVLVFGISYFVIQNYIGQMVKVKTVVVAKEDILPGQPIETLSVELADRPEYGLEDYATDLLSVTGKYMGETGAAKGDLIHPEKIHDDPYWNLSVKDRILQDSKEGDRKILGIKTDLSRSVGGEIGPGSKVDIYLYYSAKVTYLEEVPAMIIGPEEEPGLKEILVAEVVTSEGTEPVDDPEISSENLPAVVLLSLDKDQEELMKEIIKANEEGTIYLALSGEKDFD